jgi:hypothetical protein
LERPTTGLGRVAPLEYIEGNNGTMSSCGTYANQIPFFRSDTSTAGKNEGRDHTTTVNHDRNKSMGITKKDIDFQFKQSL